MTTAGGIFVDGGNMTRAGREKGRGGVRVNYMALPELLCRYFGGNVTFPYRKYYTAVIAGRESSRNDFYRYLKSSGWDICEMQSVKCSDGKYRDKGVDLSLALDAYSLACSGKAKVVVVASHDGDFAALFSRLPKWVEGYALGFSGDVSTEVQKAARGTITFEELGREALR